MFCANCGNQIDDKAVICPKCGVPVKKAYKKDKVVAGILAILVGGIGVHKFYLEDNKMGIIYLLFCWTCIPSIIGLVEGIMYLVATDEEFNSKYVK
ncbi:MAG: TM2 domain-containing protein [Clostridia bacterium]